MLGPASHLFISFGGGSANMDNKMYEKFSSVSGHICNILFSIGEYVVSEPEE